MDYITDLRETVDRTALELLQLSDEAASDASVAGTLVAQGDSGSSHRFRGEQPSAFRSCAIAGHSGLSRLRSKRLGRDGTLRGCSME